MRNNSESAYLMRKPVPLFMVVTVQEDMGYSFKLCIFFFLKYICKVLEFLREEKLLYGILVWILPFPLILNI